MDCYPLLPVIVFVISFGFSSPACKALNLSKTSATSLDALLQDYAYRAFVHPRTGKAFEARVPANLTGIKLAAMRLRSGSLRLRGVRRYKEFEIPPGVLVSPYVERLVLVYQNLGVWSTSYYNMPGYSSLTPVLGLLAYNASDLSATGLRELSVNASRQPIVIRFSDVKPGPKGLIPKCVWVNLNGQAEFTNLSRRNMCYTFSQGHFYIVVKSAPPIPSPAQWPRGNPASYQHPGPPGKTKSKTWKVAVAIVAGLLGMIFLALLLLWALKRRRSRKISRMERRADAGEALTVTTVGNTRAPVAMGTRTMPILETEYVP